MSEKRYDPALSDSAQRKWSVIGYLGTLMLVLCYVGVFLTQPVSLSRTVTLLLVILSGIGCAGAVFSLGMLAALSKAADVSRERLLKGYLARLVSGFVGGGGMLAVFILLQTDLDVSRAELILYGVGAIGGLLCAWSGIKFYRSAKEG